MTEAVPYRSRRGTGLAVTLFMLGLLCGCGFDETIRYELPADSNATVSGRAVLRNDVAPEDSRVYLHTIDGKTPEDYDVSLLMGTHPNLFIGSRGDDLFEVDLPAGNHVLGVASSSGITMEYNPLFFRTEYRYQRPPCVNVPLMAEPGHTYLISASGRNASWTPMLTDVTGLTKPQDQSEAGK